MKVLIISHNPISTYQNTGKTLLSLFSSFSDEEFCQLYIYPTLPEIKKCSSYYRMTDKDILKSYFTFKVNGREIKYDQINTNNQSTFESVNDEKLYRNKKNKLPFRMLLRDAMWSCAHWYNKDLKRWLYQEKPTCIFVAPGDAKFLYDIAIKISKKLRIPIVSYIWDDYYFVDRPKKRLKRLQVHLLQNKIEKLIKNSSHLITICKELEEVYSEKFAVPTTTIMTGASYPISQFVREPKECKSITYMGNIRCNRYLSLTDIGKEIDLINEYNNTEYTLNIYTAEKDEGILDTFKNIKSIRFCGFVSGEEFKKTLESSDLLLHTESFDGESIDLVKHSISTKIADSLSSGICLVAYGPSCVSSMKHLIRNECALIAISKEELYNVLLTAFNDKEKVYSVAMNGLITANKFHNGSTLSTQLYFIMEQLNEGLTS